MSKNRREMPKSKRKSRFIWLPILYILLILSAIFFTASRYKNAHFSDAQIDEIIFYFMNGMADGQSESLLEAVQDNLLFAGIVFFLILLPVLDLFRNKILIRINLSFLGRKQKDKIINPSKIRLRYKLIYAGIIFLIATWSLLSSFSVGSYVRSLMQSSNLYEENYVNPKQINLEFPDKKRNLIYIYLESMENTLASKANGGQMEESIIPELEALAMDESNVSFSNLPKGIGGALPAFGTTWTVAAMAAQTGGVPLKAQIMGDNNANNYGEVFDRFLPGAYTLGEVLEKEGYNQSFIMGSEATFGGRDKLLSQHGNYEIHDLKAKKKQGDLPENYKVWWGYEDKKLFEYAKTEATKLSNEDEPFNLQLLTVDTHFTDGYLDETCPTPHKKQYDNVYACSSARVGEFVEWIKSQPFYEDTTIVIAGDHLGMQTSYYDEIIGSSNYTRTIYNVFINSDAEPSKTQQRLFTSFDMYPTTLAAMGVNIPQDQLALGVNLFSDSKTLTEQLGGLDRLNDELTKRSVFYDLKIVAGSQD